MRWLKKHKVPEAVCTAILVAFIYNKRDALNNWYEKWCVCDTFVKRIQDASKQPKDIKPQAFQALLEDVSDEDIDSFVSGKYFKCVHVPETVDPVVYEVQIYKNLYGNYLTKYFVLTHDNKYKQHFFEREAL